MPCKFRAQCSHLKAAGIEDAGEEARFASLLIASVGLQYPTGANRKVILAEFFKSEIISQVGKAMPLSLGKWPLQRPCARSPATVLMKRQV